MVSFSFLNAMDPTTIIFIVLLVVLVIALLVVPMFTNKKRAKQTEEIHRSLQPGDLIKTVGGVIGTIKEIRQISPTDKEMVIETGDGDNKTTMTFDIQALYQVISRSATTVPAKEEEPAAEETPVAEEAPRVVPDILADRVDSDTAATTEPTDTVAEPEVKPEEKTESKEEPVTEPVKEQASAEKPAPKKNGGAKKSGNSAKKSK